MLHVLDLGSINQIQRQWQETGSQQTAFTSAEIRACWENFFSGLNLSRSNEDLSMAIPCFYDCVNRAVIRDILIRDYGCKNVKLVPRSLALLGGLMSLHPEICWDGNLLCLLPEEDMLDYAFISVTDACISLELQGWGNWANAAKEVQRLGFLSPEGWLFDHLLYSNPTFIASMNQPMADNMNRIEIENPQEIILLGLRYWSKADTSKTGPKPSIIYPYDFYLERSNPHNHISIREKLSFDTSNLALDLNGFYKIANLTSSSLFLDPEDACVDLTVYELERTPSQYSPFQGAPALHCQLRREDAAECLEISLDMEAAAVLLSTNEQKNLPKASWPDDLSHQIKKKQAALWQLLKGKTNSQLQESLALALAASQEHEAVHNPENDLKAMQLELYGLLALWSGKN